MEKTWETFWTSGKVTDYLTYRNTFAVCEPISGNNNGSEEEQRGNGTVRDRTGNGFDSHACK